MTILFIGRRGNMKGIILDALVTVASAGLTAIILCAVRWVVAKISTQKQKAIEAKNTALASAFGAAESILTTVTNTVVGKIEQITAGELRTLVKSGEADREQLVALAQRAYNEIVATVQPEVLSELNGVIADSETYILSKIEDAVRKVKLQSEGTQQTEGGDSDA